MRVFILQSRIIECDQFETYLSYKVRILTQYIFSLIPILKHSSIYPLLKIIGKFVLDDIDYFNYLTPSSFDIY